MLLNVSFIWFGKRFFNLFQPSFLLLIETSHWVLKVNQTTFSLKKWVKMSDGRILRENFQIPKFFGPYLSVIVLNKGKYGPEKTSYLGTFHAVV